MASVKYISLVFLGLLIGLAASQELWDFGTSGDWLSSGPVYVSGPYYNYNGAAYFSGTPYAFTEPYYRPPTVSGSNTNGNLYYPYFGDSFFTDYAVPYGYYPGYYPGFYGGNITLRGYDLFRLNSQIANQPWPYLYPNWGKTLNYAQSSSSFRVYSNQGWTTV